MNDIFTTESQWREAFASVIGVNNDTQRRLSIVPLDFYHNVGYVITIEGIPPMGIMIVTVMQQAITGIGILKVDGSYTKLRAPHQYKSDSEFVRKLLWELTSQLISEYRENKQTQQALRRQQIVQWLDNLAKLDNATLDVVSETVKHLIADLEIPLPLWMLVQHLNTVYEQGSP